MKKNIHPNYDIITVNCSCGNSMQVYSTINHDLSLDVCSKCHPFYTGKQRNVISGGRISKFNERFKYYK